MLRPHHCPVRPPSRCVPPPQSMEKGRHFRMARNRPETYGGVDTHGRTHHAAVISAAGNVLSDREFPATPAGYRDMIAWLRRLGNLVKIGVAGTGSYGAGLARALTTEQIAVVEVDRPDRRARRRKGKSDPLDALAAARAALSGEASGTPKTRSGPVEAIRALRVARRGAIKARTSAFNQLHGLIVSTPADVRAALTDLRAQQIVERCAAYRVDEQRLDAPTTATKAALRAIAQRILALQDEVRLADHRLAQLTTATAPRTTAVFGVGAETTGQMLVTAGDNPEGYAAKPRSPTYAPLHRYQPVPVGPTGTGSTAAETAPPPPLSTWSS